MGRLNPNLIRAELRSDLIKLADILVGEKVCDDIGPISDAAGSIEIYQERDRTVRLSYRLDRLVMRLGSQRKCFPSTLGDISCTLSVVAESSFVAKPTPPHDPFDKLEISFVLEGVIPNQRFKHMQSWHFDRHIQGKNDGVPENAHPIYHFQFGGRKMIGHAAETNLPPEQAFGHAALLEGPRLAHPPMDVILAVDFVLSNFRGTLRTDLADKNTEYIRMVARSQTKIWKPYKEALACLWTRDPIADPRWTPLSIWPQFLAESISKSVTL